MNIDLRFGFSRSRRAQSGKLSSNLRQYVSENRGAALVEFSLIFPLLLSLTFGMVQYSMAFFTYNTMNNAAREGARALSVGSMNETEAEAAATSSLVPWPTSWTVVAQDTTTTGTDQVIMTITIPGKEAGVVGFLPMPANLRVEVIMRKE